MYAMMAKNTTARSRFTAVPAETFRIRKRRGGRTGSCARFSATTNPRNKSALPANNDTSAHELQANVEPPRNNPSTRRPRKPTNLDITHKSLDALEVSG